MDLKTPTSGTFYASGNETSRNKTTFEFNFRNEENKNDKFNSTKTNNNNDINVLNKTGSVRFLNDNKINENLVENKNSNEEEMEKNKASSFLENKKRIEEEEEKSSKTKSNTNFINNKKEKLNNDNENDIRKNENDFKETSNCARQAQLSEKVITNNLDRFKNIVSETNKINHFENSSSKRVRTAGDFHTRRTEFSINMYKNPKNAYEAQKNSAKEYERMIKTSHEQRREGKQFIPNTKLINQKMLESDIFFVSNKTEEKFNMYGSRNPRQSSNNFYNSNNMDVNNNPKDHLTSDVFLQKNNEASKKKIGEKYLFNGNNYLKIGYYPSARSNSEWSPRSQVKSFMNYNSCEYDLFNPYMKKSVFTREKIQNEANGMNPVYRQNSITEFVDLTRNFVPNYNKEFVKAIGKEERIFSKKQDLCVNFLELHKEYNNICEKPFIKKMV